MVHEKARLKTLDRVFLILLVSVFCISVTISLFLVTYISTRTVGLSVHQLTESSQMLTKSVKNDIESGNLRYAWDVLNQSVGTSGLTGFLIFDGSNNVVIDDTDFIALHKALLSQHEWMESSGTDHSTSLLSDSRQDLIIRQLVTPAAGVNSYQIHFVYDISQLNDFIYVIRLAVMIFISFLVVSTLAAFLLIRRSFLLSLNQIAEGVSDLLKDQEPKPRSVNLLKEYFPSEVHIRNFRQEFGATQTKLKEQMANAVFGQLARQVSHDIRSPLSALNMVLGTLQGLPEDKRLIIRNATQRINDIANELLKKGKQDDSSKGFTDPSSNKAEPVMLVALLDGIVSEKRLQFRERMEVDIQGDLNLGYGLFAMVNPTDLARVVSNLVNNSIEAFKGPGRVTISIRNYKQHVAVMVSDNGEGIAPDLLTRLGERGVSHGKEGFETSGWGLGLPHARETIEKAGGTFTIQSHVGSGTMVMFTLPRAETPKWFVERIDVLRGATIVSVDDDQTIHQIWAGRLLSAGAAQGGIKHLTFTSLEQFEAWAEENNSVTAIFLVDYEFLGQSRTGLDAIDRVGVANKSVLVTSRYEEPQVRERANSLGLRILPKTLAPFVPIEIEKMRERYDAILIDDDTMLVHTTWQMMAKEKGKSLLCFSAPEEFFNKFPEIEPTTPIFIDVSLGNGVRGEEVAREAIGLGFTQVFLATGHAADSIADIPGLKGIVGKDPCF